MKGGLSLVFIAFFTVNLLSCGGSSQQKQPTDDSPLITPSDFSNLKAYRDSGPYASVLVNCVSIESDSDSCKLSELPPIGLNNSDPTIDDVLNHLVVSHQWMGDRMRDLLEIMPSDMLLMLRSNTAIVIDDDIRPAYFKQSTGAIYIDPGYLWLSNAEKITINPKEDFRSNFGSDLQFKRLWRYLINDQYAWQNYSLDGTEVRTIEDIVIGISWLFYHELAHANDCLPPDQLANLDTTSSYYSNYLNIANAGLCVHDRLVSLYPLTSDLWSSLATVLYHGNDSTTQQQALTPEQVGMDFENDHANDTYSYSSVWEDTAMVFEAVMMKRSFDADRDMVIVPFYEQFDCNTALVKWGQRGRLGDQRIIDRAKFVLGEILPEIDVDSFFATQPQPIQIAVDESYCNLSYTGLKNVDSSHQQSTSAMRYREQNFRDIH